MVIHSKKLGSVSIDDSRVITFPRGLIDLPKHHRFAMIEYPDNFYHWLLSIDDPDLAMPITDPQMFHPTYDTRIDEQTASELLLSRMTAQVPLLMVFCRRYQDWLVGNLIGPVVINAEKMLGAQVIATDKKWAVRQPLMQWPGVKAVC